MRILLFILFPFLAISQIAFPTAEGGGKNATGGKGGTIYHVTNLNTSGAGSFDNGVNSTGARTIVFDVSGVISYPINSQITISSSEGDLTIAGETAPGDGIEIRGANFDINASNVIIRNIAVRELAGANSKDNFRVRGFGGSIQNIILDHVSTAYGTDENISVADADNVTVQRSLLSDNKGSAVGIPSRACQ